ncbi:MAG: hypothetical protein JJU12_02525 [Chlamydiales bacterium]|nr:hypothetical protein [Chlamydiales bacterium]
MRHAVFLLLFLNLWSPLYAINVREIDREKLTVRGDPTAREMRSPPYQAPQHEVPQPNPDLINHVNSLQEQNSDHERKIADLIKTISELKTLSHALKDTVSRCECENYRLQQALHQSGGLVYQLEDELYYLRDSGHQEIESIHGQLYNMQCQLEHLLFPEEKIVDDYPSYLPNIPGVCGWQAGAELLVWTVKESQLDYVINDIVVQPDVVTGATGPLESAHFGWRPGARAFLNFTTCWDYWNFKLQGTFIYLSGRDTATPGEGRIMQGTFHQDLGDSTIARATSAISLNYYLIDLLMNRYFQLSQQITGRLQVGGIGAWIGQKWDVEYFSETGDERNLFDLDWRFKGGGLKIGGALDWMLPCYLGIHAEANSATLLGWYRNSHLQQVFSNATLESSPFDSVNAQVRFAHTFQIKLGPSWTICCRCFNLSFYALYEMNLWLGLEEIDRTSVRESENAARESRHVEGILGLHGATIGFQATF